MSVDYRVLECVRGAALEDVGEAIEAALARKGWVPGVSIVDEDRPIYLLEDGDWVVVDDPHDVACELWAEHLSSVFGGVAISMRIWTDQREYSLRRFDRGKLVGKLDNDLMMQKSRQRWADGKGDYVKDERDLERVVHVRTAFLADLASGASKAKLKAGVRFAAMDSEEALLKITRLAKLPEPVRRGTELEGGLQLCFRRASKPK